MRMEKLLDGSGPPWTGDEIILDNVTITYKKE